MAAVMVWTAPPRRHHNTKDVAACAKTGKGGAIAFCEALSRPGMRFVPVKSANDQAALALPKTRDLLAKQFTATVNSLRGQFSEFGTAAAKFYAAPRSWSKKPRATRPSQPARRNINALGRSSPSKIGSEVGYAWRM
jgi:transposase